MPAALRLVSGTRGIDVPPPPPTPQETEARRLVDDWLDASFADPTRAVDDLVARVAHALSRRGPGTVD